jgi:hypothetical protein
MRQFTSYLRHNISNRIITITKRTIFDGFQVTETARFNYEINREGNQREMEEKINSFYAKSTYKLIDILCSH